METRIKTEEFTATCDVCGKKFHNQIPDVCGCGNACTPSGGVPFTVRHKTRPAKNWEIDRINYGKKLADMNHPDAWMYR